MGALSYYLEQEGILTVGISLVRENTASLQVPRALWVSFPLGRPLGKPANKEFQTDVIEAMLDLLNRAKGPVLEDYPIYLPVSEADAEVACPIDFTRSTTEHTSWSDRLSEELSLLLPWHELSMKRRKGRTLTNSTIDSKREAILRLAHLLTEKSIPPTEFTWFKETIEELKFFYLEAMTARPGEPNQKALEELFWNDTVFGEALIECHKILEEAGLSELGRIVVPRYALELTAQK